LLDGEMRSILDPTKFSRDVLAALAPDERAVSLRELEVAANAMLSGAATLAEFQERLYRLIEDELINRLGHWLGPWEYDCEVEYWGGRSYIESSMPDELLLRSEYPHGVRLNWGDFQFRPWASRDE
jgi:hypothetical protein